MLIHKSKVFQLDVLPLKDLVLSINSCFWSLEILDFFTQNLAQKEVGKA